MRHNYKKGIVIFSLIFLSACLGFALLLYKDERAVQTYEFDKALVQEQKDCFTVEEFTENSDSIVVKVVYDDPNEPEYLYEYILLKDTESDACYQIPTEIIDRTATNEDGTTETKKDLVYAMTSASEVDLTRSYDVYLLNQNDVAGDVIIPLNLTTQEDTTDACKVGSSKTVCE